MNELFENIKNVIMMLSVTDYIFFIVVIALIILFVVLLFIFKNSDEKLRWENDKENDEVNDILEIARMIAKDEEKLNIDLTPYEMQEEEASIISYEELLEHNKKKVINYKEDVSSEEVEIKKVDVKESNIPVSDELIKPTVVKYEHEEALLKALKQLRESLS